MGGRGGCVRRGSAAATEPLPLKQIAPHARKPRPTLASRAGAPPTQTPPSPLAPSAQRRPALRRGRRVRPGDRGGPHHAGAPRQRALHARPGAPAVGIRGRAQGERMVRAFVGGGRGSVVGGWLWACVCWGWFPGGTLLGPDPTAPCIFAPASLPLARAWLMPLPSPKHNDPQPNTHPLPSHAARPLPPPGPPSSRLRSSVRAPTRPTRTCSAQPASHARRSPRASSPRRAARRGGGLSPGGTTGIAPCGKGAGCPGGRRILSCHRAGAACPGTDPPRPLTLTHPHTTPHPTTHPTPTSPLPPSPGAVCDLPRQRADPRHHRARRPARGVGGRGRHGAGRGAPPAHPVQQA